MRISLYSLPTKLPEYLASGRSVLVHAPKNSAVFRVAERYDLSPRLATIEANALDAFVKSWSEGKLNDIGNHERVKLALTQEFDIGTLAASFQTAFV
jgi:hypothetical protein